MQTETVLLIGLAIVFALSIALFQYYYKAKRKSALRPLLASLRFLSVFGLLLLLINPKLSKTSYTIEKPNLVLLVDNSESIKQYGDSINKLVEEISTNDKILDRFNVSIYQFGKNVSLANELTFNAKQTDIQNALQTVKEIHRNQNLAIALITDGNQTIGKDYSIVSHTNNIPVHAITIGDTTKLEDVSLGEITLNKYAFLNNKFPLETYVNYQGQSSVTVKVSVRINNDLANTQTISLSKSNNTKTIRLELDAKTVGVKSINVAVSQLQNEKNVSNNIRSASIEVLDEKTNIALISQIVHPDLGVLKKSIESNEQRAVRIIKPSVNLKDLEDIDFFILYQPNSSFRSIMEYVKKRQLNFFLISGLHTDYNFLNNVQNDFSVENGYPEQEVFGILNNGFTKFEIADFDTNNFPPLLSNSGPIDFNVAHELLMSMEIKGLELDQPLFVVTEKDSRKSAILFGEGLWKWRVQSFKNSDTFKNFDTFIGKLLRFMVNTNNKDRLNLEYNKEYEGSGNVIITASYFDEAFIFNPNAFLTITVDNTNTNQSTSMPMILRNGYYEADLTNLLPGKYSFKVNVKNENITKSGTFEISEFNVENQFVSSNYQKMMALSSLSKGGHYFASNISGLINRLSTNQQYLPTQKSKENIVSLIDFKTVMALIVLFFVVEWFLRKYNGLI